MRLFGARPSEIFSPAEPGRPKEASPPPSKRISNGLAPHMNHTSWNKFVREHGPRSGRFLQSWEWGEFQKVAGEQVNRQMFSGLKAGSASGGEEDDQVIGIAQWLDRSIPLFGSYRFCPKGPIGAWQPTGPDTLFLRIESSDSDLPPHATKSIDLDPSHTWITDVSSTEEDLLAGMHPKTRYNIRVAQKHGVRVDIESYDFEAVWALFEQTSSRGQFRLHRKTYYKQMIESLAGGECRAFLATAFFEEKLLAANIMIDFGDTRTYLHGASSNEQRNLMGPYLLHWELMRDAKEQGFRFYDWWGVAPMDAPEDHPWSGISRFKRGFGGEEVASLGTYDVVLKSWRYRLYLLVRHIRRWV